MLARCGECTGTVETVRALRSLRRRLCDWYADCTGAANIIRTLRKLYGRCGECTRATETVRRLYARHVSLGPTCLLQVVAAKSTKINTLTEVASCEIAMQPVITVCNASPDYTWPMNLFIMKRRFLADEKQFYCPKEMSSCTVNCLIELKVDQTCTLFHSAPLLAIFLPLWHCEVFQTSSRHWAPPWDVMLPWHVASAGSENDADSIWDSGKISIPRCTRRNGCSKAKEQDGV